MRLLTTRDVASELQVSMFTVRKWVRQGRLRAVRLTGPRAHLRFREGEVRRLIRSGGSQQGGMLP